MEISIHYKECAIVFNMLISLLRSIKRKLSCNKCTIMSRLVVSDYYGLSQ